MRIALMATTAAKTGPMPRKNQVAAGAKDVGRADVLRSVGARIRQREDAAHDHRERDRSGEVAPERVEERRHGPTLQYAPWIRSSSGSFASMRGWGSTSGRSSARRRS